MSMFNTVILLGTLTGILLAVGWLLGGMAGVAIALVFSAVINFASYWYSDKIVLAMYHAKPFANKEIDGMLERLAREARIAKPRLYVVDGAAPNAFATGRDDKNAVVAVTNGMLGLEKAEMEGVLAHELGHIVNKDMLVSSMAATIAGAISFAAQFGYWAMLSGERDGRMRLIGFVFMVFFAPIAAMLVRMAISRQREYLADFTSSTLTRNPKALASALRKISAGAGHSNQGSVAASHLWIVNPFKGDWFVNMFSTHPPVQKRIERLEEIAHAVGQKG
ncbi:MAG: M48 family metalloprotease [Candidatus Aenigmarchaeota archaeon]|nr:M48 family metalloprotease [Candidatus Aenigmarchaeota archaeon]